MPPFISMRHIFKTFSSNGANALDYADFDLYDGEIHALLGENGAGKSTLMHILAGFVQPDSGKLFVDGKECRFLHYACALKYGIGIVRQKPLFADELKAWEACSLNIDGHIFYNRSKIKNHVEAACKKWGLNIPLDNKLNTLNTAQRLELALLSLLIRDVRCMIFDEPTAALNEAETKNFLSICTALVHPHIANKSQYKKNMAVVIISHKLEETLQIADRITVLRKGKTVAVQSAGECPKDKLLEFMFEPSGDQNRSISNRTKNTKEKTNKNGTAVLDVVKLCVKKSGNISLNDISFKIYGRICGVAGVRESGRTTLELSLAGFLRTESGSIFVNGKDITNRGSGCFREAGGAFLCSESVLVNKKLMRSCENNLSLQDNLIIHCHKNLGGGFFLNGDKVANRVENVMRHAGLSENVYRCATASTLSGGMLQRLLISRELAEDGNFIIASDIGMALDTERKKIFLIQ